MLLPYLDWLAEAENVRTFGYRLLAVSGVWDGVSAADALWLLQLRYDMQQRACGAPVVQFVVCRNDRGAKQWLDREPFLPAQQRARLVDGVMSVHAATWMPPGETTDEIITALCPEFRAEQKDTRPLAERRAG